MLMFRHLELIQYPLMGAPVPPTTRLVAGLAAQGKEKEWERPESGGQVRKFGLMG